MPVQTLDSLAGSARRKADACNSGLHRYIVSAMLAGAYVGVGVFLAYAVGGPLAASQNPFQKVIMGGSFAIALSLVVFAGGELFTGNAMTMPVGRWRGSASTLEIVKVWGISWVGNLLGALLLAWALQVSGVMGGKPEHALIQAAAEKKMHLEPSVLIMRGVLCNWLVCLGVWCATRMKSEAGKLIMIFWCLYAFVAAGFEHSVANMTLFSLALMQPHTTAVTVAGALGNLGWVTLGNLVGGAVMVGGAYQVAAGGKVADNQSIPEEIKLLH